MRGVHSGLAPDGGVDHGQQSGRDLDELDTSHAEGNNQDNLSVPDHLNLLGSGDITG